METTITTTPPATDHHADFRSQLMTLPVEQMKSVLSDYADRRKAFRDWLLSHMKPGVHYGFPPGCVPKFDDKGNMLVWNKSKGASGGYDVIPPEQWTSRPSLYEAGADLIADLLMLRLEYATELGMWQMMGSLPGRFFLKCQVFGKRSGELLGEGIGAAQADPVKDTRLGQPVNSATKIAKKRAKVDAVKNCYGLSDLFTQDLEDDTVPPPVPPEVKPDADKVPPRADRVTSEELTGLMARFKAKYPDAKPEDFATYCLRNGGARSDVRKVNSWSREQWRAMDNHLRNVDGV
jgi:hypothetical protein